MYQKTVKYDLQKNIDEIIKYKNNGMYDKDIAKIYGVSKGSINRILHENGIYSRNLVNVEDIKDNIIEDYKNGSIITDIAKKYKTSAETVSEILHSNDVEIRTSHKTYSINEHYFDEITEPNQAYILGLLVSDGCICRNTMVISLQENDRDILDKINIELGSNRPLFYRVYDVGKNQYRLSIANKYMTTKLKELGVWENKSNTVQFLPCITDELLPHFLRGLFDGDGFLSKSRYRVGMTGTKYLLFEIMDKLKRILGINFKAYEEHNHNGITYSMKVSNKRECMLFLNYIYKDHNNLYLNRKYELYQKYLNGSLAA